MWSEFLHFFIPEAQLKNVTFCSIWVLHFLVFVLLDFKLKIVSQNHHGCITRTLLCTPHINVYGGQQDLEVKLSLLTFIYYCVWCLTMHICSLKVLFSERYVRNIKLAAVFHTWIFTIIEIDWCRFCILIAVAFHLLNPLSLT